MHGLGSRARFGTGEAFGLPPRLGVQGLGAAGASWIVVLPLASRFGLAVLLLAATEVSIAMDWASVKVCKFAWRGLARGLFIQDPSFICTFFAGF